MKGRPRTVARRTAALWNHGRCLESWERTIHRRSARPGACHRRWPDAPRRSWRDELGGLFPAARAWRDRRVISAGSVRWGRAWPGSGSAAWLPRNRSRGASPAGKRGRRFRGFHFELLVGAKAHGAGQEKEADIPASSTGFGGRWPGPPWIGHRHSAATDYVRRRMSRYSRVSLSSLPPTGVPQVAQRYSYLWPVGRTSSRCLRTGRGARQRGQNSSETSSSSKWDRRRSMLSMCRCSAHLVKGHWRRRSLAGGRAP